MPQSLHLLQMALHKGDHTNAAERTTLVHQEGSKFFSQKRAVMRGAGQLLCAAVLPV